jgi:hypothetical protein
MRSVVVLALCLAALPVRAGDKPKPPVARVSPAEFFTGELKKLEPHLGLTASGCVAVEPAGGEQAFYLRLEEWKGGKRADTLPGLSLTSGKPFEVSVSVREDPGRFEKPMYRVVVAWAGGGKSESRAGRVAIFETGDGVTAYPVKPLAKAIDLEGKGSVVVWGLMAGKLRDSTIDPKESVEEMAKRVPWALLLRVMSDRK